MLKNYRDIMKIFLPLNELVLVQFKTVITRLSKLSLKFNFNKVSLYSFYEEKCL